MTEELQPSETPMWILFASASQRRAFRWKLPIRSFQSCHSSRSDASSSGRISGGRRYAIRRQTQHSRTPFRSDLLIRHALRNRITAGPADDAPNSAETVLTADGSCSRSLLYRRRYPVRCFAPAVFRHSTPCRELPRYFGISIDTAENTRRLQNTVYGQIPA
jgi:hypothetical protein